MEYTLQVFTGPWQTYHQVPCESCTGIELNYSEESVRTDADYIKESLAAVKAHGFGGAVLSWDVTEVPDAHIEAMEALE